MVDQKCLSPYDGENREAATALLRAWNQTHVATAGQRRGVYIATFGCQQNQADSERLLGMALDIGYEEVGNPENADLILVNTCAIREHAENRALALIGEFKHLREKKPDLVIGVCGCMVSQDHRRDRIRHSYPYVTFTLGTSQLHTFPDVLWECVTRAHRVIRPEENTPTVVEGVPVHRASTYRAWVSIMYGCNNFCSYCIVPYVRGRERSRDMAAIVAEVRALVEEGYKDITLLGQNVNSYGRTLEVPCDFADLLAELDAIPGDWWLRFMTSHPKDASYKLMDVMAGAKHLVPSFHLPLQSGSDSLLKSMNRHYDMARYRDIVRYMRQRMPEVTLTSDIIVGFPGETDEDYEATLAALREMHFDMIFAFIYSPRKGTPAANWTQVPPEVQKQRFMRMMQLQDSLSLESNQPLVGRTLKVLCDGESKKNAALYTGRTEGNKSVFFEGTPDMVGQFVWVHIQRAEAYALHGEVVTHP